MFIYHNIYQTTNLINGKIYIGKHSTTNINDGYMGSGKAFKYALRKYGKENFKTQIIFCAFNENYAYEIESIIVNEEFVKRSDNYNEIPGGRGLPSGELHPMKNKTHTIEARKKISESHKGTNNSFYGKTHNQETRNKISKALTGIERPNRQGENHHFYGKESPFKGKTFSEDSLIKLSKSQEKFLYTISTPDGIVYTTNLNKFCKENNLNQGAMSTMRKNKGYQVVEKKEIEKAA